MFLQSQIDLSDEEWNRFRELWKLVDIPKKTLLLQTGEVEKYLSFVEKGIVRHFLHKPDGKDVTIALGFDGWFTSAYDSYTQQSPSEYNIETLTKAKLWRIHYDDLQNFYQEWPKGNTIGRLAAERLLNIRTMREISLLRDTPDQLYANMLKNEPHLIKHVPLQYLASFIGITPQALSRVRARIV